MTALRSVTLSSVYNGPLALTYSTKAYDINNAELFAIVGQAIPVTTLPVIFSSVDVNVAFSIITLVGNTFVTGQAVKFSTNGTLPAELNNVDTFYIIKLYGDNVCIASTQENAASGQLIVLSTTGSGNMTVTPTAHTDVVLSIKATIDDDMWPKLSTPTIKLLPEPTLITYDVSVADKIKFIISVTSGLFNVKINMRTKTREI